MVHTRPRKYVATRGRRYAKGDIPMRKRGVAVALAATLLSLTLCGCGQYSEDDYKQNYRDGFCAGVAAANRADAACLFEGPGGDIGVQTEILDSYLAGEGVYTYEDAKDAIDSLYRCYDELMELYGEIEDGSINVDYPDGR